MTAALELARRDLPFRIIEARPERKPLSKALGVNPRTLDLLEPSDLTELLLRDGRPIAHVEAFFEETPLFQAHFDILRHRFPYIIALPQHNVEAHLEKRLGEFGITVERGTKLVELTMADRVACCRLDASGSRETVYAERVLGADGARSLVRESAGIDFPGPAMHPNWSLADVVLDPVGPRDTVRVRWDKRGVLVRLPFGSDQTRLFANHPDLFDHLPDGLRIAEVGWQSEFHIRHCVADTFRKGPVFLAGDAAHIHSPLGARGMNLGIEDACAFARDLAENNLETYGARRRAHDQRVVRRVHRFTNMAASTSPAAGFFRRNVLPKLLRIEGARRFALKTMSGLSP